MRVIPKRILYLLVPFLVIGVFALDTFLYFFAKYNFDLSLTIGFVSVQTVRELAVVGLIAIWYWVTRHHFLLGEIELPQKLWRLTLMLLLNFIPALLADALLPGELINGDVPPTGLMQAMLFSLYNSVTGLIAIATLIPILKILRELIFYKPRRTTRLYFAMIQWLMVISAVYVLFTRQQLNLTELGFGGDVPLLETIMVWSILIIIALLSFRNDWITYLPRRQKAIYLGFGVLVYAQILSLPDYVYQPALLNYSGILNNLASIMSLFLTVYGGLSIVTFLVHLPTAKAVDRKLKEVKSLNDFSRMLNTELNYEKLIQLITQLTSQVLESQTTWLARYDPDSPRLKIVSHINLTQQQILNNPFLELEGLNRTLLEEQMPILINDINQNRQMRHLARWKKDARALLAAPLIDRRNKLMGIIYATKMQPFGFDTDDVSLMEGFANQSAIALENAQLWQSSLEKERLEQELKVAREVQLKLVPQEMPEIPGFELDSYFLTAYEVGGDYYDFIHFADGQPGVVIGDVSGKGTSAAFYMAEFKGVIQTLAQSQNHPRDLASHTNRVLYGTIERKTFVTAIVGKFLAGYEEFEFVRAGHTPILYYNFEENAASYLCPKGLGIGLDPGTLFDSIIEIQRVRLKPGDYLILSTDGLSEARNQEGEEFGEERVIELMNRSGDSSAPKIKEALLNEISRFIGDTPLHDDLTLIVIKCERNGAAVEKASIPAAAKKEIDA